VLPLDKRELDIGFDYSKLELDWVVDSFKNDTMKISLAF